MSPWDRFFFEPRSTSPIALVRVVWGLLATVWGVTLLPDVDPFLTDGALRYDLDRTAGSWDLLGATTWSGAPLAVCVVLIVAGLATAAGALTRLSTVIAALCMLLLQRANVQVLNSGDLLLREIGVILALSPAGLVLSVDAWWAARRGRARAPWRAPWALRLLQLNLAVGYFLSGWAKVRGDTWHEGTALGLALRIEDLSRFTAPEILFEQSVLLNLLTWGVLVFELGFAFAVWNRRLRPWVLGAGVAMHLGIDLLLDVGFFSYAVFCAYLVFLPPDVADRVVDWIRARVAPATTGARSGTEPVAAG